MFKYFSLSVFSQIHSAILSTFTVAACQLPLSPPATQLKHCGCHCYCCVLLHLGLSEVEHKPLVLKHCPSLPDFGWPSTGHFQSERIQRLHILVNFYNHPALRFGQTAVYRIVLWEDSRNFRAFRDWGVLEFCVFFVLFFTFFIGCRIACADRRNR